MRLWIVPGSGLSGSRTPPATCLWRLEESASGFFIHDAQRPGGPKFEAVKNELARSLNREADMLSAASQNWAPKFGS